MAEDITVDKKDEEEEVVVSTLELSDDDFAKLPEPVVETVEVKNGDSNATTTDSSDSAGDTDLDADDSKDEGSSDAADKTNDKDQAGVVDDKAKDKPADTKTDPDAASVIDYKVEYEKLTAPFKANGLDIQVKNTDEIISLMQMGANYHKKMASLKPSLKIMKLLERHELLDESKLGYLIDLSKKDPAAITKLMKDSGIDPLSIDTDADSTYTPKTSRISDTEMALESVLEAIQETPSYARTLKVVSETWDDASRNVIAADPKIISIINEHIGSGIFDKVINEVERARRFGKLQGVSDFEAYKQMGDYLHSQGQLGQPVPPVKVNADDAQKKEADEKRKAQKKAATITTSKSTPAVKTPSNILSLSDDDFNKLPPSAYTQIK
jgi:hypothetical protein